MCFESKMKQVSKAIYLRVSGYHNLRQRTKSWEEIEALTKNTEKYIRRATHALL